MFGYSVECETLCMRELQISGSQSEDTSQAYLCVSSRCQSVDGTTFAENRSHKGISPLKQRNRRFGSWLDAAWANVVRTTFRHDFCGRRVTRNEIHYAISCEHDLRSRKQKLRTMGGENSPKEDGVGGIQWRGSWLLPRQPPRMPFGYGKRTVSRDTM